MISHVSWDAPRYMRTFWSPWDHYSLCLLFPKQDPQTPFSSSAGSGVSLEETLVRSRPCCDLPSLPSGQPPRSSRGIRVTLPFLPHHSDLPAQPRVGVRSQEAEQCKEAEQGLGPHTLVLPGLGGAGVSMLQPKSSLNYGPHCLMCHNRAFPCLGISF